MVIQNKEVKMIIKTLSIIVSLMVASPVLAATGLIEALGLESKIMEVSRKTALQSVSATEARTCKDYTGVYTGRCDDMDHDVSFEIQQQGCEFISVNGQWYSIGHIQGATYTGMDYVSIGSEAYQWANNDALLFTEMGHIQFSNGEQNYVFPLGLTSHLQLIGNGLSIDLNYGEQELSCLYSR
jgi:hypothetical protein